MQFWTVRADEVLATTEHIPPNADIHGIGDEVLQWKAFMLQDLVGHKVPAPF